MRSHWSSSFFAELLGEFRFDSSCEVVGVGAAVVLYEGWEGLIGGCSRCSGRWNNIRWRLVLDAIVRHIEKCAIFILLWKLSLNVS